jgi:prolyl-tRNA synthetase
MSTTIEAMMGDTRALQSGTSHFLGQNFAKAFDIQFSDQKNELQYAWTTSWGLSTRFVGAIIMTHGDDLGLILPPRLAPIQVVVIPIFRSDIEKSLVLETVERVSRELRNSGIRFKVDDREEMTPGRKYYDWEMRGIPLRIEIGPKDVEKNSVALARRDKPGKDGKSFVSQENLAAKISEMLAAIQTSMLERATEFRDSHIHDPRDFEELSRVVQDGWALSWWCESKDCETKVKEDTKASTRCIPVDQAPEEGKCIVCGQPAKRKVYFARSY